MGIFDLFRRVPPPQAETVRQISADAGVFLSMDDPRLVDFLRGGMGSAAGISVSTEVALRNPAVFRSVSLVSQSIGMLPVHLVNKDTKEKARDQPLFPLLHRRPNSWQTAYDFRTLMQLRALVKGNAYALILWSRDLQSGKRKISGLVPLDPDRVSSWQNADWTLSYRYSPTIGPPTVYGASDIFHLRNLSTDGINGVSLVRQAADAIGLAIAADLALSRMYKHGSFVDGILKTEQKMSQEAVDRLREGWSSRYTGADNAGRIAVLEQGLSYTPIGPSARDAQSNETRGRQIEEIARIFGVPRPLLMIDETSWGSGIDVLGQFFVQYGLSPWFEAWQQAAERSLLSDDEADELEVKFNPAALLRGSMAAQGDFFAKALGSGGQQAWMTPNEVRDRLDMPAHADGDDLTNPMMAAGDAPALDTKV